MSEGLSDSVSEAGSGASGERTMTSEGSFIAFIPVSDLTSARHFYVDVLGLPILEESPFAVVVDAMGTMLRLTKVEDLRVQAFTIAGWQVPDIRTAIDSLTAVGVVFTRYEGMDQDDRGVWTTPGGDQVAWFTDPDGNTLSLTRFANV
jgi:catechol 2,3-dioxygenase-like lactoylglutathione lyase family enzyme